MAALQSGGRLLAPIEQETALAWAGFVLLTLDAIGVQQHAEVCSQLQPPMPAILCHALYQLAGKTMRMHYLNVACIFYLGTVHCSAHVMCIAYCSGT
jgi:hypothetical protein